MKKFVSRLMLGITVMLLGCITICAAEVETVQKNMVLETVKETQLLEAPNTTAKPVVTLQAGTPVFILEDESDGWCKVSSQEQEGYMKASELKRLGNQEELNAEFDKIGNTVQLVFDEIVTRENEEKQARIWGTIMVVLIAAIFGVGMVSALKKNKLEKEN